AMANQQLLRYRYYSSPLTAILYNPPQNIIIKSPHPPSTRTLKISPPQSRHQYFILNRKASSSSSVHNNNNSNNTTAVVLSPEDEDQGNIGSSSSSTGGSGGGGDGNHTNGQHSSNSDDDDHSGNATVSGIIIGLFVNGWRSRVAADPEFPFKLLMEQVVGLTSCVLGDMASRPNFGLNELDFVFSTLVVGAILNFVLMYILAPTTSSTATATLLSSSSPSSSMNINNIISSIFSSCPKGHMFESGSYSVLNRFGTLVYKGIFFSAVGFAAGLVGTAISTGLMKVRKKMDPHFVTPNKPPPTVLNALTWAAHMGLSCNLRYQTLTGVEFLLGKSLPPWGFKTSIIVLRCLNNVFGGVSFVMMARLTGSQKNQLQKLEQEETREGIKVD
ncbi:Reticulata-related 3 protein, partial [Thalictrum thalictroides]